MQTQLAFDGIDHSSSLEAAVQRWLARLDDLHPLASCAVTVRIHSRLLGLDKRASVELAVSDESGEIELCRAARIRHDADLYPLISEAFRELRRRLADRHLCAAHDALVREA